MILKMQLIIVVLKAFVIKNKVSTLTFNVISVFSTSLENIFKAIYFFNKIKQ